jgi:hydroxymethylglutaryl-CoA lyase
MKIIECPRDAMQGLEKFVETDLKASYINALLKVGFDTIDFGSFVSQKAIPQMRDTSRLIGKLDESFTKLLAIIANKRGAIDACCFERIDYLGFPFSVSEEFQKRNTNKTIDQSLTSLEEIQEISVKSNKSLVVYLSMAFGNPYGEKWHEDMVAYWSEKIIQMGIKTIALSDTIGVSDKNNLKSLFQLLTYEFPEIEWGAHLHTHKDSWREKVEAAYNSGCRRFDSAIKGFGGCPMAKDELVGNLATESLISYLNDKKINNSIDALAFENAFNKSLEIFNHH